MILSKTNESSTGGSVPPDLDGSSLNGDEDTLDVSTQLHAVSTPTLTGSIYSTFSGHSNGITPADVTQCSI